MLKICGLYFTMQNYENGTKIVSELTSLSQIENHGYYVDTDFTDDSRDRYWRNRDIYVSMYNNALESRICELLRQKYDYPLGRVLFVGKYNKIISRINRKGYIERNLEYMRE